jgi:hypothetical protein
VTESAAFAKCRLSSSGALVNVSTRRTEAAQLAEAERTALAASARISSFWSSRFSSITPPTFKFSFRSAQVVLSGHFSG